MQNDFAKALPRILVYEGLGVDDKRDPGGRTYKGVTQTTFNIYLRSRGLPARDVFEITDAEVATIYFTRYWTTVCADALPCGLDLVVFDAAVNSGPGQAGRWLQAALGSSFAGPVDGLVGKGTLQAVEDFGNVEGLINAVCERRLATLKSLRTWRTFGGGWGARIANVMKTGDAWAAGSPAPHPVDVSAAGGHRKALIGDIKVSRFGQASAHAATAVTGAGTLASDAAGQLQPVQQQFPNWQWLTYGIAGLTVVGITAGIVTKIVADTRAAAAAGTATATVNLSADEAHPQVEVNDDAPLAVTILPQKVA